MNIIELSEKFPTERKAVKYFEKIRWDNKIVCPYCKHTSVSDYDELHRHKCYNCRNSFSVTVNTQLHHTRVPLKLWLFAFSLITDAKKGISTLQLQRNLKLDGKPMDYKTVHRMHMKIRELMAMEINKTDQLDGIVEIDETYIGGKLRLGEKALKQYKPQKREPVLDAQIAELKEKGVNFKRGKGSKANYDLGSQGRNPKHIPVIGIVQRNGDVVAEVMRTIAHDKLRDMVKEYVDEDNATLVSDSAKYYVKMDKIIDHIAINHKKMYSYKGVNTNSIESFWAIIKRGIMGQYHHVSAKHLPEYIAEFVFKYNNRKTTTMFQTLVENSMKAA
ncbi:MAG: IS1595 family transposase [Bacteroidia bacterium]